MSCLLRLCAPWGVVTISEGCRGEFRTFLLLRGDWGLSLHFSNLNGIQATAVHLRSSWEVPSPSSLLHIYRLPKMPSFEPRPVTGELRGTG